MVSLLPSQGVLGQADGSSRQVLCIWVPYDERSKVDTARLCRVEYASRPVDIPGSPYGILSTESKEEASYGIDRALCCWRYVSDFEKLQFDHAVDLL